MTGFTDKLSALASAADEMHAIEADLEQARKRFRKALQAAHDAGAKPSLLARVSGLSRQRVSQLVRR